MLNPGAKTCLCSDGNRPTGLRTSNHAAWGRAMEEGSWRLLPAAPSIISHDRWFSNGIATHIRDLRGRKSCRMGSEGGKLRIMKKGQVGAGLGQGLAHHPGIGESKRSWTAVSCCLISPNYRSKKLSGGGAKRSHKRTLFWLPAEPKPLDFAASGGQGGWRG